MFNLKKISHTAVNYLLLLFNVQMQQFQIRILQTDQSKINVVNGLTSPCISTGTLNKSKTKSFIFMAEGSVATE